MKTEATFSRDERIESGGDDLGSIWYDFYNMTMEKALDWIKRKGFSQYQVANIKVWKKYWLFGPETRIHIVFDKLDGPPRHKSEFYELLRWVVEHGRGHRIEFTTDNRVALITIVDKDGNTRYEAKVDPEEFRKYYSENGHSIYFLRELWENLHPSKVHTT